MRVHRLRMEVSFMYLALPESASGVGGIGRAILLLSVVDPV